MVQSAPRKVPKLKMVAVLQCRHLGAKAKRGKGKMFRGKGLAKKRKRGAGKSFRGKGIGRAWQAPDVHQRKIPSAATFKRMADLLGQKGKSGWSKYLGGSRAKVKC
jgi:hypothetical protein